MQTKGRQLTDLRFNGSKLFTISSSQHFSFLQICTKTKYPPHDVPLVVVNFIVDNLFPLKNYISKEIYNLDSWYYRYCMLNYHQQFVMLVQIEGGCKHLIIKSAQKLFSFFNWISILSIGRYWQVHVYFLNPKCLFWILYLREMV